MIFSRPRNRRHPKPGTAEYEQHITEEIEHYAEIFKDGEGQRTLLQPVPSSWHEAERRAAALVRDKTGADLAGHVVTRLNRRPGVRMLSLGSGPGGVEISFAQRAGLCSIVCVDINSKLLELGRQRARELNLKIDFENSDLNTADLPKDEFDIVFCHASLHHVVDLERLCTQIQEALHPGGELITVDVITRNGYLMWPETREVVKRIWKTLPERFRLNHTSYGEPRLDDEIVDIDQSETGMECIRSQDILPALDRTFSVVAHVPYFSIARRFFDTMYGPNYDLSVPLDRSIFEWIWELDRYYLETHQLRPETFFGIYRKPGGVEMPSEIPSDDDHLKATGLIEAYPNPIIVDESGIGATTLVWHALESDELEVHLGSPDGPLFSRSGATGAKVTGKWVKDRMVFYLQNVTDGLELSSQNTLCKVEITATNKRV